MALSFLLVGLTGARTWTRAPVVLPDQLLAAGACFSTCFDCQAVICGSDSLLHCCLALALYSFQPISMLDQFMVLPSHWVDVPGPPRKAGTSLELRSGRGGDGSPVCGGED